MSMELYVLSDAKLTSVHTWQQAIDQARRSLQLSTDRTFAELNGALPVTMNGTSTSFECDHWDADEVMGESSNIRFGRRWKYALAFRWGGNIDAGVAAYAAAAGYARATRGVILDCEEGKIISAERAVEISAEIDGSRSQIEAAMQMVMKMYGR